MLSQIFQQRLTDLLDHITQDQKLLKEFEEALTVNWYTYTANPGSRKSTANNRKPITANRRKIKYCSY
jgi:hypothetical protein